jgi:hypothetical protein
MVLYHEIVEMQAGATPLTFDGAQTARFNDEAKTLVAMVVSHSLSARTTDESIGMLVRLGSTNWAGFRYFAAGLVATGGPATNCSAKHGPATVTALNIPIRPNTTMSVDITTVIGATQTGTNDVTIDFIYDDGGTPRDIIENIARCNNGLNPVAAVGGTFNYDAAVATTARTAMTYNNAAEFNIPAQATEIIGALVGVALDGAVTADENLNGYIEFEFGIPMATDQKVPLLSNIPQDGTEVDGADWGTWSFIAMHVPLPDREIQAYAYTHLYEAVTNGCDLAVNLLWR